MPRSSSLVLCLMLAAGASANLRADRGLDFTADEEEEEVKCNPELLALYNEVETHWLELSAEAANNANEDLCTDDAFQEAEFYTNNAWLFGIAGGGEYPNGVFKGHDEIVLAYTSSCENTRAFVQASGLKLSYSPVLLEYKCTKNTIYGTSQRNAMLGDQPLPSAGDLRFSITAKHDKKTNKWLVENHHDSYAVLAAPLPDV